MKRLQPSKQFLPTLNDNDVNANQRLSSHTQTHGQPDDESSTPPLSKEAQTLKLLINSLLREQYFPSASWPELLYAPSGGSFDRRRIIGFFQQ